MTGGKYKRMQWKQKMKARSQSFGGDKCFKCGQTGHWANKCQNRGKASVPQMECPDLDSVIDDRDFPTIREAFGMSRGISKVDKSVAKAKSKKGNIEVNAPDCYMTEILNVGRVLGHQPWIHP